MSTLEITFLIVAALPVFYRSWCGWRTGATAEARHLLVNLFGVFVALRYWQPWSETVAGGLTFDPRFVAAGSFVLLFAIGTAIAGFAVDLRAPAYQAVKADYLNRGLGLLSGISSGAILAACILWLAMVITPSAFESSEQARTFATTPREILRFTETAVGVAPDSAGRTRYPQVTFVEVPADASAGTAPNGAVLMQQRGRIAWQP